jgi:HEAT repeat protein
VALALEGPIANAESSPLSQADKQDIEERVKIILGDNSEETRMIGARDLITKNLSEADGRLVEILKTDKNLAARLAVVRALRHEKQLRGLFVDAMLDQLGVANEQLLAEIVDALGMQNSEVLDKVSAVAAESEQHLSRRLGAIEVLGSFVLTERGAVTELVKLLKSNASPAIKSRIVGILHESVPEAGEIGETPESWIKWEDDTDDRPDEWRRRIIRSLNAELQNKSVEINRMADHNVRLMQQIYDLTSSPDGRGKLLHGWIDDPSPQVKTKALMLIQAAVNTGWKLDNNLFEALTGMLTHPDPTIRRKAVLVLRDIGNSSAVAPLLDRLDKERNSDALGAVVNALGYLGDAEVLDHLLSVIKAPKEAAVIDSSVKGEAARAVRLLAGLLAGKKKGFTSKQKELAVDTLVECYKRQPRDKPPFLREAILASLSAPELIDADLVDIYVEAIGELQTSDVSFRVTAANGLGGLALVPKAAEALRAHIGDKEAAVRKAIVEALSGSGSLDDLMALKSRFKLEAEPDEAIRKAAWKSVCSICDRVELDKGLKFADSFEIGVPPDPEEAARFIDLAKILEPRLIQSNGDKIALANMQEKLGEVLLGVGRVEEAIGYFVKAIKVHRTAQGPYVELVKKIASRLLDNPARFEHAAKFSSQTVELSNPNGDQIGNALMEVFQSKFRDLKSGNQAEQTAANLKKAITKHVASPWKERFQELESNKPSPGANSG